VLGAVVRFLITVNSGRSGFTTAAAVGAAEAAGEKTDASRHANSRESQNKKFRKFFHNF
jgi:hypothetical protein